MALLNNPETQVAESLRIERGEAVVPEPPRPVAVALTADRLGRRPWFKLPAVHSGYERVPDREDGTRMVRCRRCPGKVITSLGIGYHEQWHHEQQKRARS